MKLRVLCGGKMTKEERDAKMASLLSKAKDLDCLRNEFRNIKPGEEGYSLSDASKRALMRIRKEMEKYADDD